MIGVKLQGRMGNQLFQYAFIYSVSKKLNTRFYLEKSIDKFVLPKYFKVPPDAFYLIDKYLFGITGFKHIFSYHLKRRFYGAIPKICGHKTIDFFNENTPELEIKKIKNRHLYSGFYQSEIYFKDFWTELRPLFQLKDEYIKQYNEIANFIPQGLPVVTVHVRRGDYIELGFDLPLSYFHSAIKKFGDQNAFYIFVSDNPQLIEKEFSYIENKYISKNSEIIDFQLLINADVCILSNSSFSWWGAYLNNKNAKIVAPKFWLNKVSPEMPSDIIPANWIKF